jgi:membrane protease YdiL (CAAX protease family)
LTRNRPEAGARRASTAEWAGGSSPIHARLPDSACLALLVLGLAANAGGNWLVPAAHVALGAGLVGWLTAVAAAGGVSPTELGLARRTTRTGLAWGAACVGVVVIAYGAASLTPPLRGLVSGSPAPSWPTALVDALVRIPLGTVIPEEFAFRGVLWALLRRRSGVAASTAVAAGAFGLWHVLPALGSSPANAAVSQTVGGGPVGTLLRVGGTVVFTAVAGVLFTELRRRSGSLVAPALLHWGVNGGGVLFTLLG